MIKDHVGVPGTATLHSIR